MADAAPSRKKRRLVVPLDVNLQCPCCFRPGQPFCDTCSPEDAAKKLVGLRALMGAYGIDAYVVLSEDAHSSEYIAAADERRSWLTGLSGSAGVALVTQSEALLWTDSRYFLQAEEQLKGTEWVLMKQHNPGVPLLKEWVYKNLSGKTVGVDPVFVSSQIAEEWRAKWGNNVTLKEVTQNLVDAIWFPLRPEDPCNPIVVHPLEYAGEAVADKLKRLQESYIAEGAAAILLSALDQIAWLFNLRGSDIECNPVFFAYAVVLDAQALLFVRHLDEGRGGVSPDVAEHLRQAGVELRPYSAFFSDVKPAIAGKRVFVDPSSCSMALMSLVAPEMKVEGLSPAEKFKAAKNQKEIEGLVSSSRKDSLALCELFASIEERLGSTAGDPMTESQVAAMISAMRMKQPLCVGDSFPTISSVGPNSAIVHYRPDPKSSRQLDKDSIFLIDTGGQYKDGTTDITRTVHFGTATDEQQRLYTRVLQGHMALARAVFPDGTPGLMLDTFARMFLWQDGLNYGHGTGHGMGAYMNVHEGPMGIGGGTVSGDAIMASERMKRVYLQPLRVGHFVSDEPGCYKDGDFGIRIESDLVVTAASTRYQMGGRPYLRFEYLTLVPMCRSLIDTTLISADERAWLDSYHEKVWKSLEASLTGPENARTRAWLERATRPLA